MSRLRIDVPVSDHPVDSVNLKDPKLGIYEQIVALVKAQGVTSGRVRLELAGGERQAGLTVNEYETLLMRHDLAEVLRNPVPLRGGEGAPHVGAPARDSRQGARLREVRHGPRAEPDARRDGAARLAGRAAVRARDRASRRPFLRMKRAVNLRVRESDGHGVIADGRYQSPILVQWNRADGRVRTLDATLTSFE